MDQGASTSLNPNEDDIPGYGSTTPGPVVKISTNYSGPYITQKNRRWEDLAE